MQAATALLFAMSAYSTFATSQPLSREDVQREMISYKAAGYNPARQNPRTWVDDAQAASARVEGSRMIAERSIPSVTNEVAVTSE
ncbi:DUF4148 domain-containing protein [Caballeronia sp. EK]|nr:MULTISPECIES: DUF4148 domain-containing protein [Caballeronia]MBC8641370.1 DUF4148 domain-containing protein [Caballeronia sp. EK]GGD96461.1 hypothetical protein GCM10010985_58880 [Caballeronia grimmiae]